MPFRRGTYEIAAASTGEAGWSAAWARRGHRGVEGTRALEQEVRRGRHVRWSEREVAPTEQQVDVTLAQRDQRITQQREWVDAAVAAGAVVEQQPIRLGAHGEVAERPWPAVAEARAPRAIEAVLLDPDVPATQPAGPRIAVERLGERLPGQALDPRGQAEADPAVRRVVEPGGIDRVTSLEQRAELTA